MACFFHDLCSPLNRCRKWQVLKKACPHWIVRFNLTNSFPSTTNRVINQLTCKSTTLTVNIAYWLLCQRLSIQSLLRFHEHHQLSANGQSSLRSLFCIYEAGKGVHAKIAKDKTHVSFATLDMTHITDVKRLRVSGHSLPQIVCLEMQPHILQLLAYIVFAHAEMSYSVPDTASLGGYSTGLGDASRLQRRLTRWKLNIALKFMIFISACAASLSSIHTSDRPTQSF